MAEDSHGSSEVSRLKNQRTPAETLGRVLGWFTSIVVALIFLLIVVGLTWLFVDWFINFVLENVE